MGSRNQDLSHQNQWPNGRGPLRPIDVFSGAPIPFRVLFPQIRGYWGPGRDVFSCLRYLVVTLWLAENVLESPVSNGRIIAIQQPFNSLVLLPNFQGGGQSSHPGVSKSRLQCRRSQGCMLCSDLD